MPQPEQVLDGQAGTGALVDGDRRQPVDLIGFEDHGGHAHRQTADRGHRRRDRSEDDQPRDRLRDQLVDRLGQTVAIEPLDGHDADAVAHPPGGPLDAEQRGRRSVEQRVEADHPDRAGSPAGQAAGQRVGPEVQLLDGAQHPLACLLTDAVVVVQHPRHRLVGDLGQAGDVLDHSRSCWLATHPYPL